MAPASNPKAHARPRRDPQSGVVAVWVAVVMIPMLLAFAVALNMGILMDTKTELQSAADATALAAVRSLNGLPSGITAARAVAVNYSQQHKAYGETLAVDPYDDLSFGRWKAKDCSGDCFEQLDPTVEENVREINAVKVVNGRDGQHGTAVNLPSGGLFTSRTANVTVSATAVGGGPSTAECPMPLTLAECKAVDPLTNKLKCNDGPHRFVLSNDSNDGMGFVNLYGGPANGNTASDILRAGCQKGGIGTANVQNGNALNQNSAMVKALIGAPANGNGNGKGNGGACYIGSSQTFPVVRLDCPGGDPKFNQEGPVVGFLTAKIIEVVDNNGDVQSCYPGASTVNYADNSLRQSIVLEISCEEPTMASSSAGGAFFNTGALKLRLVQ
jgi:hypothetical protein